MPVWVARVRDRCHGPLRLIPQDGMLGGAELQQIAYFRSRSSATVSSSTYVLFCEANDLFPVWVGNTPIYRSNSSSRADMCNLLHSVLHGDEPASTGQLF